MEIVYIIYLLFYFMKNSPPPLSTKKKSHKTCEFAYMYYAFKFLLNKL